MTDFRLLVALLSMKTSDLQFQFLSQKTFSQQPLVWIIFSFSERGVWCLSEFFPLWFLFWWPSLHDPSTWYTACDRYRLLVGIWASSVKHPYFIFNKVSVYRERYMDVFACTYLTEVNVKENHHLPGKSMLLLCWLAATNEHKLPQEIQGLGNCQGNNTVCCSVVLFYMQLLITSSSL